MVTLLLLLNLLLGKLKGSSYVSSKFHPVISKITHSAYKVVDKIENQVVIKQAEEILTDIENALDFYQQKGIDVSYLPSLIAIEFDDGSLLIEWVFDDFHLGFSIEPSPDESSWYIVSNEKLNNIFTSDYFKNISHSELFRWFVGFALQNS